MKQIIKFTFIAIAVALGLSACTSQNIKDDLANNTRITDDQVSFSYAASAKSDNILVFTNTSDIKAAYKLSWDLGNGTVVSNSESATGVYPDAGDYTVTLTVSGADGTVIVKTQAIHIAKDDPSLFDTPTYLNLTGGVDSVNGKTWIFDQYNQYTKEVATATGKNIGGHMGLGPLGTEDQEWWAAGPNEKSFDNVGWYLYDFRFNFALVGLKLNIANAGWGYGRNQRIAQQGFVATNVNGEDATFKYNGGDYTYTVLDDGPDGFPQLTLSGNAFMGYYCGSQNYDIIYLTDQVMALSTQNTVEGQDWVFIFIRPDLQKNMLIPDNALTFTMTPGSDEFTYNYSVSVGVNPNDIPYTVSIDFGDGVTQDVSSALTGSHEYVVSAGTYTATCTVTAANKVVKQQTVVINNNNPKYDATLNLVGTGKSWKLRPDSEGSGIIMTRAWTGEVWWTVTETTDGANAAYDDVLTFYGDKVKLDNHGDSFMNESTASLFSDGDSSGSFVTKKYVPSTDATWSIVNIDDVNYLKLENVFPMYAVNPDVVTEGLYQIVSLTPNLLQLRYINGEPAEWDPAWNFYLVPAN